MKLNETPALPMAPESNYDRALQRALTDILRPLLRKVNAVDTSDGGYVAPTLLNGWKEWGDGYNPAGYMLDGLGFVHLRGLIKLGTMHSPAFQLPPGFRPAYDEYMATIACHAFAAVTTTSAGNVIPREGVNTWFSLDGITFKAAQ